MEKTNATSKLPAITSTAISAVVLTVILGIAIKLQNEVKYLEFKLDYLEGEIKSSDIKFNDMIDNVNETIMNTNKLREMDNEINKRRVYTLKSKLLEKMGVLDDGDIDDGCYPEIFVTGRKDNGK